MKLQNAHPHTRTTRWLAWGEHIRNFVPLTPPRVCFHSRYVASYVKCARGGWWRVISLFLYRLLDGTHRRRWSDDPFATTTTTRPCSTTPVVEIHRHNSFSMQEKSFIHTPFHPCYYHHWLSSLSWKKRGKGREQHKRIVHLKFKVTLCLKMLIFSIRIATRIPWWQQ